MQDLKNIFCWDLLDIWWIASNKVGKLQWNAGWCLLKNKWN